MNKLDKFFEWETGELGPTLIIELATRLFPGESVVIHLKEHNRRHSYVLRWELIHFEHRVVEERSIRTGLCAKLWPQFDHYQLRRLPNKPKRWHICWSESIGDDESTHPLRDPRGYELMYPLSDF